MAFIKILVIAVVLIALAWAAIGIKMFVKKDGKFTKTCSSVDSKTGKPVPCSCHSNKAADCDNQ